MRKVLILALKDLKVLFRDKAAVFWVLFFPLLMALFFGSIFSGGGGSISGMNIAVIDLDSTEYSQAYTNALDDLSALRVSRIPADSAVNLVRTGKLSAMLKIKKGFGKTFGMFTEEPLLEIGIDPARKMTAGYLQGLLTQTQFALLQSRFADPKVLQSEMDSILADTIFWSQAPPEVRKLSKEMIRNVKKLSLLSADSGTGDKAISSTDSTKEKKKEESNLFPMKITDITNDAVGPRSPFEITFPSSMLWALIGIASTFAVSIVRERTAGTMTRLRLAPISYAHILGGKGLACFIASFFVSLALLLFGNLVFGVRIGNPVVLLIALVATSFCFVGIAMFISTIGKTEQSVSGASWGILLVAAMTGGGMLPLMFMPSWLVTISNFSPVKWGILAIEGGIWRGFTYSDLLMPIIVLLAIGTTTFTIGVTILARRNN